MSEDLLMDPDLIDSMSVGVIDYLHHRMQEAVKSNGELLFENIHATLANTLTYLSAEEGIDREWLLEVVGKYYDNWEKTLKQELNA